MTLSPSSSRNGAPFDIRGGANQQPADFAPLLNVYSGDGQLVFQVDSGGEVFVGGTDPNAVVLSAQTANNPTTSPVYVSLDGRLVLEVTKDGGLIVFPKHSTASAFTVKDSSGSKIIEVGEDTLAFFAKTLAAQAAHISDPSGGATVDANARTAINAILDLLESYGLMAV